MKFKKIYFLCAILVVFCVHSKTLNAQGSKIERLLNWGYKIVEGDTAKHKKNFLIILPIWGVSPETGWQLGLSSGFVMRLSNDSITRPSLARLNWQFTEFKQLSIRPTLDLFFKQNKYYFKGQFVYNDFNEYFWGIGNQTDDINKEQNEFKQMKLNLRLLKQKIKGLYVGPQLQYEKLYNMKLGPKYISQDITGLKGFESFGIGAVLVYDNRDEIFYTQKGTYIEVSSLWLNKDLAGQFSFDNYFVDARHFKHLGKRNILAFQFIANFNNGNIPYRQLSAIGNENFMRGYYNGRYRDKHLFSFQTELRTAVWGPLGAVFFGGIGNVGNSIANLSKQIKPNYGLGIRGVLLRKDHINFRIDWGFGEDRNKGLYLTLHEAF
jgi:hypothetical protein